MSAHEEEHRFLVALADAKLAMRKLAAEPFGIEKKDGGKAIRTMVDEVLSDPARYNSTTGEKEKAEKEAEVEVKEEPGVKREEEREEKEDGDSERRAAPLNHGGSKDFDFGPILAILSKEREKFGYERK